MITFTDFSKLEIKIGTVKSVSKLPNTDKLLLFIINVGAEERQIVAGMSEFFPDPSVLIGKQLPVLLNLEPRTFQGITSRGMIMAADVAGRAVLLHPAEEVPAGSVVK